MTDLDRLGYPGSWIDQVAARNPENAFPNASAEVVVEISRIRNLIVQTAWNADGSGAIWSRYREQFAKLWSVWTEQGNTPDGPIYVASLATIADGQAQIILPDWQRLTFAAAQGSGLAIENNSLRVIADGFSILRLTLNVTHNWGSVVHAGVSVNGGAIVDIGETVVASNEPVRAVFQTTAMDLSAGTLLAVYLSSNFEYQPFSWSSSSVALLAEEIAVPSR